MRGESDDEVLLVGAMQFGQGSVGKKPSSCKHFGEPSIFLLLNIYCVLECYIMTCPFDLNPQMVIRTGSFKCPCIYIINTVVHSQILTRIFLSTQSAPCSECILQEDESSCGKAGISPLIYASEGGHISCVEALTSAGAFLHQVANDGGNPLYVAVQGEVGIGRQIRQDHQTVYSC